MNWIDTGLLPGYRIPGSKVRRVPVEDLRRFMLKHGMPLRELGEPEPTEVEQIACPKCEGKREFYIPGRGFENCDRCKGKGTICV